MEDEGYPNSTLVRNDNSEVKTVVFVGNGAVENGWTPLRQTMDMYLNKDTGVVAPSLIRLRKRNKETFHQLAILSYKFKIARGMLFFNWSQFKKGDATKDSVQVTQSMGLPQPIGTFLSLRADIACAYKTQSSNLSLRINTDIEELIGTDAHFVTTNWDNTIWNHPLYNKNVVYMHGRCDYKDSLVLPTELLVEDAAYDFSIFTKAELKPLGQPFASEVVSAFRCAHIRSLLAAHDVAIVWLKRANRIVIWGFSLADYDADINALIATHTKADVSQLELVVIDPEFEAFRRAVALTGITNALHYDPLTMTRTRFVP